MYHLCGTSMVWISNPVYGGQCHLTHLTILRRFSWPNLACTHKWPKARFISFLSLRKWWLVLTLWRWSLLSGERSPAAIKRWINVGLTLVLSLRRWTNAKPTLIQHPVLWFHVSRLLDLVDKVGLTPRSQRYRTTMIRFVRISLS